MLPVHALAIALAACSCVCVQAAVASVSCPGTSPGAPAAHREGDVYTLGNNVLTASWKAAGARTESRITRT